ncbi:hypothetical protein GQ42DRAFT_163987 [Ramicandelaber brevisporus]|nr:hypothetical protein GQ42DRAFT_163987 [Ramicandelaber brevisporus]
MQMDDPGAWLTEYVSSIDNVPGEVHFLLTEIHSRSLQIEQIQARIDSSLNNLQQHLSEKGYQVKHPNEDALVESVRGDYAQAKELAIERTELADQATALLTKHLQKLERDLGVPLSYEGDPEDIARGLRAPIPSVVDAAKLTAGVVVPKKEKNSKDGSEFDDTMGNVILPREFLDELFHAAGGAGDFDSFGRFSSVDPDDYYTTPRGVRRTGSNIGRTSQPSSASLRRSGTATTAATTHGPSRLSRATTNAMADGYTSSYAGTPGFSGVPQPTLTADPTLIPPGIVTPGRDGGGLGLPEREEEADTTLYCLCKQGTGGTMIACENETNGCPIGWYHLACVGLEVAPEGAWYCQYCISEDQNKRSSRRR